MCRPSISHRTTRQSNSSGSPEDDNGRAHGGVRRQRPEATTLSRQTIHHDGLEQGSTPPTSSTSTAKTQTHLSDASPAGSCSTRQEAQEFVYPDCFGQGERERWDVQSGHAPRPKEHETHQDGGDYHQTHKHKSNVRPLP